MRPNEVLNEMAEFCQWLYNNSTDITAISTARATYVQCGPNSNTTDEQRFAAYFAFINVFLDKKITDANPVLAKQFNSRCYYVYQNIFQCLVNEANVSPLDTAITATASQFKSKKSQNETLLAIVGMIIGCIALLTTLILKLESTTSDEDIDDLPGEAVALALFNAFLLVAVPALRAGLRAPINMFYDKLLPFLDSNNLHPSTTALFLAFTGFYEMTLLYPFTFESYSRDNWWNLTYPFAMIAGSDIAGRVVDTVFEKVYQCAHPGATGAPLLSSHNNLRSYANVNDVENGPDPAQQDAILEGCLAKLTCGYLGKK